MVLVANFSDEARKVSAGSKLDIREEVERQEKSLESLAEVHHMSVGGRV